MREALVGKGKDARGLVAVLFLLIFSFTPVAMRAQDKSRPEPEVLVFANGEKLIGHFESFAGGSAKFKSDTLGKLPST